MQVDAIGQYKGQPGNKGGKGGKGKQKGKNKGKSKGDKHGGKQPGCKGGNKGKHDGVKGGQHFKSKWFEGCCNGCKTYGHKHADCWHNKKQTAAVANDASSAEATAEQPVKKVVKIADEADEWSFPGGLACRMCWSEVNPKKAYQCN